MQRTEKTVRDQVEREEGPIPDEWWRDLVKEEYVGRAKRSPSDGIPLLISRVRTLKRLPPWELGGLSTRTTYSAGPGAGVGARPSSSRRRGKADRREPEDPSRGLS